MSEPGHSHSHGNPKTSMANWRNSDLTFGRKLRVAMGNTWIKIRKRQTCCGHPGEPGC